jgi:ankyrin repeat protein
MVILNNSNNTNLNYSNNTSNNNNNNINNNNNRVYFDKNNIQTVNINNFKQDIPTVAGATAVAKISTDAYFKNLSNFNNISVTNNRNTNSTASSNKNKYITTLTLPTQYIDLSTFFYSPPEKFNRYELKTSSPNQSSLLSSESSLTVVGGGGGGASGLVIPPNQLNIGGNPTATTNTTQQEASLLLSSTASSLTSSSISTDSSSIISLVSSQISNHSQSTNSSTDQANTIDLDNLLNSNNFVLNKLFMMMSNNMDNNNLTQPITNNFSNSGSSSSDDHEELLAEMELIERLPTQERLKQAKRRRALQLKKWSDYERELNMNTSTNKQKKHVNFFTNNSKTNITNPQLQQQLLLQTKIKFQDHIVLLDSIMRKDYQEVELLLESGVPPNSSNEDGLTAIHQCCIDDSADLLRLLIKYGADVNVVDNDLWTPLHAAATCANLEICKILIENKADLLAVNTDGNMPYDICDDEECLEYIESEMASRGVTQQTIDMKRSESEIKMLNDLKIACLDQMNKTINRKLLTNNPMLNSFVGSISASTPQLNSSLLNNNYFLVYFKNSVTNDGKIDLNAKDSNGATLVSIFLYHRLNFLTEHYLCFLRI